MKLREITWRESSHDALAEGFAGIKLESSQDVEAILRFIGGREGSFSPPPRVPQPALPERPMAPAPRPVAQHGGPSGVATDPKLVATVWRLHDQGGLFQRQIGEKTGLSQTTVSRILRRPRPEGDVPVPKAPAAPGAVPTNGKGQKIYATSVVEAINRIWRGATDDGISRALGVFTPPQVQRIRSELWTIFELKDQKQPLVEGEKTWSTKSLERRDVVVGRIVKSLQEA